MTGGGDGVAVAVPLAQAMDASAFGAKAAHLGLALAHGLPVPPGMALSWAMVDGIADGNEHCVSTVAAVAATLTPTMGTGLAVRSSAVGEDSAGASFAGQHVSLLNVQGRDEVIDAVVAVRRSAHDEAALGYRRHLGLPLRIRVGTVVQQLVDADVSGVLFDPHPVTGAPELVIEAAWGLGEAVANGAVVPDLFRLERTGEILERRAGTKEVEIRPGPGPGTTTRRVAPGRVEELCLDDAQLSRLHWLASRCREAFGGSQDLEWAIAGEKLWLLQRRSVTTEPKES